jgi:hypothetical protein
MIHLQICIAVKGFLVTCLEESNISCQYTCILTNNAQELTPYRFEFEYNTHRVRQCCLSVPRFYLGSLGFRTDSLAHSAMPPLQKNT